MWTAGNYISTPSTDAGRSRVPTLRDKGENGDVIEAKSNRDKTHMFCREFFPIPPENLQVDEDDHEYPEPKFKFEPISDERIKSVIKRLAPYKAPDSDEYSNAILRQCTDILAPRLGVLYRAVNELKYWPEKWSYISTIVLRKPGKGDYTKPGSHRPISLIKKFAMVYSKCLSEDLIHQVEAHALLASTQFG
ncbi:hypothetical protein PUNSTDRAFT_76545, partial [Punctularia strigosozonata HHB-11173 SS5]